MSRVLDLWSGLTAVVLPFAGATAPDGWLLCFGQAVSRTTYATLFAVIGTTYGVGDGSATFNLPDLRGRAVAGKDNMGGTAAGRLTTAAGGVNGVALGAAGGGQAHTLTEAQMPSHGHSINDPGHIHPMNVLGTNAGNNYAAGGSGFDGQLAVMYPSTTGVTINGTGGNQAHPNVQPTLVLNHIIRA